MMRQSLAIETLSALAHETRLNVYRLLAGLGSEGMPAGDIAARLKIPPTSLSNHLGILARAGVVSKERQGRSIIYRARPDRVVALSRLLADG